jgi:hypothetical protein
MLGAPNGLPITGRSVVAALGVHVVKWVGGIYPYIINSTSTQFSVDCTYSITSYLGTIGRATVASLCGAATRNLMVPVAPGAL